MLPHKFVIPALVRELGRFVPIFYTFGLREARTLLHLASVVCSHDNTVSERLAQSFPNAWPAYLPYKLC
jgi:hypothetical protein